jgi:hypothetical protein
MKTIQEIDNELEKLHEENSKLFQRSFDQEQKLKEEKRKLLVKEILDSKPFNRYKWTVENRDGTGFILRPIFGDDLKFDDIQTKLDLYPHGGFQLNGMIEINGDDGDLYIVSSDINAGIEFIKSQNIKIIISEDIIDSIASMEKQIVGLKEFVNQFNIIKGL